MAGLAIGVSAALVIYLIVSYEFSFDTFEKDNDRIYRVVADFTVDGKNYHSSGVANLIPPAVNNEINGLEIVAPIRTIDGELKITTGSSGYSPFTFKKQSNFAFVDESYFKLLSYKWLAGSPVYSLKKPGQVVLTESNATLFFPLVSIADIPGRMITINDSVRLTITGIVKDLTENTDFRFRAFISLASLDKGYFRLNNEEVWSNINRESQLWIKLTSPASPDRVIDQVNTILKKHRQQSYDNRNKTSLSFEPLSALHFNTNYDNFGQHQASKPVLYGLIIVATFVLALGCINFINLTTAQVCTSAKKIDDPLSMEIHPSLLLLQFLCETFLLVFVSFVLSIILVPVILFLFSGFIPSGAHLSMLFKPGASLLIALLLICVAALSAGAPVLLPGGIRINKLKTYFTHQPGEARPLHWFPKTMRS